MIRVFIVDENYDQREIDGFIEVEDVERVEVKSVGDDGQEVVTYEDRPIIVKVQAKVPNPDYKPSWICVNVDNDEDAQKYVDQGAKELSQDEITETFGDLAAWASPLTVKVSEDGKSIESFTPTVDIEPTVDELAARARNKRDALISETDYLLMPDYPIGAESLDAVKAYRQALRDVPEQEGFPASIVWPELPEVLKNESK